MSKLSKTVFAILILSMVAIAAYRNMLIFYQIVSNQVFTIPVHLKVLPLQDIWVLLRGLRTLVTVVVFAPGLGLLGFGAAGIIVGKLAAMMSAAAINGGGVAAGSVVAALQSLGATGLTLNAALASGSVGAGSGYLYDKMVEE